MKRTIRYYSILWFRNDLTAGLSVFFVALPLCLGIALASGAPLYSGLLSGIIGGIVVSLISGSHLAVSGPAAGLTTVVSASILAHGEYKVFLLAVIVAGLFQLLLGLLKLGVIANYFPSAVIKGMLAAIGIILISKQIPVALGYDQPDFWTSGLQSLFTGDQIFGNLQNFNQHISRGTIIISAISLLLLIFLQLPVAKKLKVIPTPLLVVVLAVVANLIFMNLADGLSLKPTQLVNIPSNIFADISFPDISKIFSSTSIWKDGLIIGLLATLETLLCIEAIDKLDWRNRITPVNRELIAQGIGNITCGFMGAIPITAVVVRGSANVDAGARTKLAAFTHGLFLLLAILLVPFLLNKIPYACLAAILIMTGYNLTKPHLYRHMWKLGLKQFLPFMITIIVIIATDLLIGVSIGLLIAIYYIIQNNFRAEYKIIKTVENDVEVFNIKLNSDVTFLNKANLKKALDEVPPHSKLTIDGSHCNFIDYDILEIFSEYENKARERKIELTLKGIKKVSVISVH
ncbi:MAG TPA: SulP family inorganic anion transporter [Chitinophagaceae bacterium]|jgi:MFS superfamily sulfate permease-like transporter|nr:SulP family inorganic anion transporter [Chitinophagaceae bacterium]HMW66224.1 SulP family inorganic anion transporter [Chitinophagaceae bacterium]HNA19366.1 SulP family inorganic anion transporter [Chitinophagaceae bacterium]HNA91801.1 SulP family inorganic anion transporter [Chitinophagaceae bacterium]HNA96183.1 SulP family inorganic anion transporter [Chitinophagaceae bacterium]